MMNLIQRRKFGSTALIIAVFLILIITVFSGVISPVSRNVFKSPESAKFIRDQYIEILNRWPVPSRKHTISTSQGETFVIESGSEGKPKLILLHGSMSNSLMWMKEVLLWEQQFHIYTVDIIGEPGLSAPSRPALNTSSYAQWLDEIREQLGIQSASFIGTSLGGWFALDYTIRRPEAVDNLVLVSPGGVGRQRNILWWVIPLALLGDWGKNKTRQLMVGEQSTEVSELGAMLTNFLSVVPQHFNPRLNKLPIFTDEELGNIKIPVMAVVGGKDLMLDAEQIRERLNKNIKNLKLEYLPEARHYPGDRSRQILSFLEQNTDAH